MNTDKSLLEAQSQPSFLGAVSGSATPNFLKVAVDELLTYRTPKKIIDYIEAEKMKSIIGNPPFDSDGHYR